MGADTENGWRGLRLRLRRCASLFIAALYRDRDGLSVLTLQKTSPRPVPADAYNCPADQGLHQTRCMQTRVRLERLTAWATRCQRLLLAAVVSQAGVSSALASSSGRPALPASCSFRAAYHHIRGVLVPACWVSDTSSCPSDTIMCGWVARPGPSLPVRQQEVLACYLPGCRWLEEPSQEAASSSRRGRLCAVQARGQPGMMAKVTWDSHRTDFFSLGTTP